jgi:hypothetical protein
MMYAPKNEAVCENIERGNREYRIKITQKKNCHSEYVWIGLAIDVAL